MSDKKNKCIIILIILLAFNSCTSVLKEDGEFRISGKIEGLDSAMFLFVSDSTLAEGYRYDSIPVIDGKFEYVGKVKKFEMLTIAPSEKRVGKWIDKNNFFPAKASLLYFLVYPGADVKIAGKLTDFVDAHPYGDKANNDLARLHKQIFPLANESVNKRLVSLKDTVHKISLQREIDSLENEIVGIKKKFISKNKASIVSFFYLDDMMMRSQIDDNEAIKLYAGLDTLVRNNFSDRVASRINGVKSTILGHQVPEITAKTHKGENFKLSSLKGKYVVLYFWGTWCGPCLYEMPKLKSYYDRYKDKVEFVGIAEERSSKQWTEFLNANNYDWIQILNDHKDDLALKYNIHGFPTKFIVDPNGKILGRFIGNDDMFYVSLEENIHL